MLQIDQPQNEPILSYESGSPERDEIHNVLDSLATERLEIPCIIGGKEVRTGNLKSVVMPHVHRHVLADAHMAGPAEIQQAAQASLAASAEWANMSPEARGRIFLKAADLLAGPYRYLLNAATMLGQSKNVYQAEIDSACELIDFFRFNAFYYQELQKQQPISPPGVLNQLEYRPLEGFVAAITPFNFTAIAGNLPATPALAGNTVLWKPSDTQLLSAYYTMKLFQEAGVPDGVINFIPADGPLFGDTVLKMRDLSGVHFTGSTATFQKIWKTVGGNIENYRSYPRIVGETGGKDFIFAHASADIDSLVTALVRGAFEYQGQKCSAASRAYIPKSLWSRVSKELIAVISELQMGDVRDFSNFVNAVIDERSFNKIDGYLKKTADSSQAKVLIGGRTNSSVGYFIEPTVIHAQTPDYPTMVDELFGPVLSVYVYPDQEFEETLRVCDQTSPYGLTGAVFSQDRYVIEKMKDTLKNSAGNFYVNDKCTGAVVGQQPFGGARASGTNDKAGSPLNLYRWISPRTIKETLVPPKDYRYPFLM